MRGCILAPLLALLVLPTAAQEAGDPAAGRRLAEVQCSSCHAIGPGRSGPNLGTAPAFADIARLPSTTSLALRAFLQTQHGPMPAVALRPEQIDDLVAWILALRGEGQPRQGAALR